VQERLSQPLTELDGMRVKGKKTTADGPSTMLEDDSWVLMRASGTEPVVRLYVEAGSEKRSGPCRGGRSTSWGSDCCGSRNGDQGSKMAASSIRKSAIRDQKLLRGFNERDH